MVGPVCRTGPGFAKVPPGRRDLSGELIVKCSPWLSVTILAVCHEIPIRYALNAAAGSDRLDGPEHRIPNATPYLFDESALERAAEGIERLLQATGRDAARAGEPGVTG